MVGGNALWANYDLFRTWHPGGKSWIILALLLIYYLVFSKRFRIRLSDDLFFIGVLIWCFWRMVFWIQMNRTIGAVLAVIVFPISFIFDKPGGEMTLYLFGITILLFCAWLMFWFIKSTIEKKIVLYPKILIPIVILIVITSLQTFSRAQDGLCSGLAASILGFNCTYFIDFGIIGILLSKFGFIIFFTYFLSSKLSDASTSPALIYLGGFPFLIEFFFNLPQVYSGLYHSLESSGEDLKLFRQLYLLKNVQILLPLVVIFLIIPIVDQLFKKRYSGFFHIISSGILLFSLMITLIIGNTLIGSANGLSGLDLLGYALQAILLWLPVLLFTQNKILFDESSKDSFKSNNDSLH